MVGLRSVRGGGAGLRCVQGSGAWQRSPLPLLWSAWAWQGSRWASGGLLPDEGPHRAEVDHRWRGTWGRAEEPRHGLRAVQSAEGRTSEQLQVWEVFVGVAEMGSHGVGDVGDVEPEASVHGRRKVIR